MLISGLKALIKACLESCLLSACHTNFYQSIKYSKRSEETSYFQFIVSAFNQTLIYTNALLEWFSKQLDI